MFNNTYVFNQETLAKFISIYFEFKDDFILKNDLKKEKFLIQFNSESLVFELHSFAGDINKINLFINTLNKSNFILELKDYFSYSLLFNDNTFSLFMKRKYGKKQIINSTTNSIFLNNLN